MSNLVINANSIYDRVIRIGRQTENLVSSITFNLNMWIEEYGAGECVLNVRRNGDGSAYPVPMTITDGMTTWTITDTDTAKKGRGEIQLVYSAGEKVKTSPIFTISCGESLVGGEVPEPYEEWLTELNRMTAEVEAAKTSANQSAQTAQTAAGTATERATEAEQSANTASGFAVNASASATSANASAQAAAQSAGQAASSVADVEASAQAASASAQSAEVAKTAAQTAEASAHGFAQTASQKASEAAESAVQAQESVTDAQAEVTRASAEADRARAEAEQAASRIYDLLPTDSASGAVASFMDGADDIPLKSLVVGINPVQSGEGDPSPENIRPITGWTETNIHRYGRNLVGVRGTWDANGGKTSAKNGIRTAEKIPCVPGEVFTGYKAQPIDLSSANMMIREYDQDGKFIRSLSLIGNGVTGYKTFTVPAGIYYIAVVQFGAENFDFGPIQVMFYKGADEAEFEPYAGSDITVSWAAEAGTVYGGSLDVLTGVLTVTHYGFDGGNVNWSKTDSYAYGKFSINTSPLAAYSVSTPTVISSAYKSAANSSASADGNYVWIRSSSANICQLRVKDDAKDGMTAEEFKDAMSGVQFVYELKEPITYQLTPHEVKTLLGSNTFYADTGDTAVEYRADIKAYINRKIAEAIAALS